jgi:hypothetical protein
LPHERLTTAIASVEGCLTVAADFKTAESNLHRAMTRVGNCQAANCQAAYCEATDQMRRQFNLAFFKRR